MYTNFSRGAAAALLGITLAAGTSAAGAQVVRTRDTVIVRTIGPGEKMDSIRILMRALEQEAPGTELFTVITKRLDSLVGIVAGRGQMMFRSPKMSDLMMPKGYLGLSFQGPRQLYMDSTGQRITYLAYPSIVSVDPQSPAERAGILPGDVLVAYDGVDVLGHEFNMTRLIVPDRKLGVSVRRDGERKEYTLTIARLPERMALRVSGIDLPGLPPMPPRVGRVEVRPSMSGATAGGRGEGGSRMRMPILPGGIFLMTSNGVLGAHMSAVGADLAKALHLSTGVLVNEVPESSPAFASGLRVGDVIVAVAGQPVASLEELHALFGPYMSTHEVPFRVVRDKKSRDITVRW
jgi:serine protease Do